MPQSSIQKKNKQVIHLYTLSWNEEKMLGHFFNHYDKFVDAYFFFDDKSNDSTINILQNHPRVTLANFPRLSEPDSFVLSEKAFFNSCWKQSRGKADWVIVTEVDEFLFHPNLLEYLHQCTLSGITAIPAIGIQMISDSFPSNEHQITDTVVRGMYWDRMSKLSIFKPTEIHESNFSYGKHKAEPIGNIVYPKADELLNLHYKYLSEAFVYQRYQALKNKLGQLDLQNQWGYQYHWDKETIAQEFIEIKEKSTENIFTNRPVVPTEEEKWWRIPAPTNDITTDPPRKKRTYSVYQIGIAVFSLVMIVLIILLFIYRD